MFKRERLPENTYYLSDKSLSKGYAKNVILPMDETELREGTRYSNKGNTKVTISGNRTGMSAGAVPHGGDIMSMEHLSDVIGIGEDEKGVFVRALPATTVSEIDSMLSGGDFEDVEELTEGAKAKARGKRFPVSINPKSSVGGSVSVDRGLRQYVRRIKVVFSDSTFRTIERGECHADGNRMEFSIGRNYYSFNLPGYTYDGMIGPAFSENMDLIDLFIGSEGVFAMITEADIYLTDVPVECAYKEIGKLNVKEFEAAYGKDAVNDMKRIKSILDPNYILNVGNLF